MTTALAIVAIACVACVAIACCICRSGHRRDEDGFAQQRLDDDGAPIHLGRFHFTHHPKE